MTMLDGKVAIVTGAARGIGRATAEMLRAQGAKVMITDIDSDAASAAVADLRDDADLFAGDLTRDGAAERLIQATVDRFGQLDIIVNNAGYTLDAPVHKLSDDWWQRMLDIHVTVPFRIIRAAAPHLREPAKREREQGIEVFRKIVNVSSTSGTMGSAGQANYASGKAALIGLTKTLAKEWGQFKINVNAVAFGVVETRLTAVPTDDHVAIGGQALRLGMSERQREQLTALIPLGRPARPEEAAGAICFLCTPWSDYVHGQTLTIAGGLPGGMVE